MLGSKRYNTGARRDDCRHCIPPLRPEIEAGRTRGAAANRSRTALAEKSETKQPKVTMSAPPAAPFDVHAYTSRYPVDSETRLQRLLHVAHRFDDGAAGGDRSDVTRDALSLAVAQMRAAGNYRRYAEEYGAVAECGTPGGGGGDDAGAPLMSPVRPAQVRCHAIVVFGTHPRS